MPRESLPVTVEQFWQLEHYMTRAHRGSGLALYMVKTLSELIGIENDVDSEFDKGSTFTLTLPISVLSKVVRWA